MAMTMRNWWFVLPSLSLLAAPACGDNGGSTTGSTGTDGTTEPATTDGTATDSTSEPSNPSSPATSDTPTTDGTTTTTDPTVGTTDAPGTTTEAPGTTTDDTTTGTTGPVEPGPEDIPEIPDDGMPSSAHFKKVPLGMSDAAQGYWEYTPPGYGGGEKYPLMIFLHGIGENGNGDSELDKVPNNGPPKLQKNDQWDTSLPFVVLSPQHPGGGCPGPGEVHSFIEFALTHYDINPARVYLTGLSCGAIGSWNYLGEFLDEQIAAMVPIAGDGKGAFNKAQCELGRVPIWAFHGDADPTVNVSGTIQPVEGLQACDPKPDVEMVIYPGVGHDSWTKTYDLSAGHDIYAWMLERYKQ
ncbi:hypothetical protein [Nannocystis exedens]|uniref:carboxylesterase family protein n=1 Tax=Nannocystis exedens TaxID=54 RepID=UPI000BC416FC|nr:hypothetical protein [Nannocystis exedens]PCC73796.1 Phospholipase/Carboxylesterase [Nannocystis exedens]